MSRKLELTGKRFGKLLAKREAGRDKGGHILWLCLCDCGNEKIVRGDYLRSGTTRSCGCLPRPHNMWNKNSVYKECLNCGFGINCNNPTQKYCDEECSREHYKKTYIPKGKKGKKTKECLSCGEVFVWHESRPQKIYCTQACGLKHYRKTHPKQSMKKYRILERDKFQCIYCGKTSYGDKVKLHVDHVIPQSTSSGVHTVDNLVTACEECNLSKSAKELGMDIRIKIQNVVKQRNDAFGFTGEEAMYEEE